MHDCINPLRGVRMQRLRALLVLSGLVATALLGTLYAIAPAAFVLLLPAALLPPRALAPLAFAYRACVDSVAWFWFSCASGLIEWVGGTRVSVSGEGSVHLRAEERVSLLICNHNCRLDWM